MSLKYVTTPIIIRLCTVELDVKHLLAYFNSQVRNNNAVVGLGVKHPNTPLRVDRIAETIQFKLKQQQIKNLLPICCLTDKKSDKQDLRLTVGVIKNGR